MNIRFLGAHNSESKNTRAVSLLIDEKLALDAGGLTSGLSFQEQLAVKALLVTHHHYDHIKDIPMMGMTFHVNNTQLNLYSIQSVREALTYIFRYPGKFYTNFLEHPPENPTIKFTTIEPLKQVSIEGFDILAVPMKHSVPSVGYQITSSTGECFFYSGDTGAGLEECWQHISPTLLVIEVTAANGYVNSAREVSHLTPVLLEGEMAAFRKIKGYLPQIITVHMFPHSPEKERIEAELKQVAGKLNASITLAYEGMQVML